MFRSAVVSPLTDCCSDRPQGWPNPSWKNVQTIFPFRLKHADCNSDGAWLTHSEMQSVHRLLNRDLTATTSDAARCQPDNVLGLRFQIGQPVQLGQGGRSPVNVLRICLGAHVVSRVVFGGLPGQSIAQRIKQEQHRIEQVFHKIQTILDNWSQWQPVDAARVSGRPEHVGGFPCESVKLAR
jgi:hypothetical protein